MIVRQDLEQQCLGLHLDPVHLIDEQYHGLGGPDGLKQRTLQQEFLTEDVLFDVGPAAAFTLSDALGLDTQQLLLVVPLVECLGLVQAFVALQTNETRTGHTSH